LKFVFFGVFGPPYRAYQLTYIQTISANTGTTSHDKYPFHKGYD